MDLIETMLKLIGALVLLPIVVIFIMAENTYKGYKELKDKL